MANPITNAQQAKLLTLIVAIGKPRYWEHKQALHIPRATPITRLTRGQAWKLIDRILKDPEGGRR